MPFQDSTPLINDPDALQERARSDGYLFFRGLLPAGEPEALRDRLSAVCAAHGFYECPPLTAERGIDQQRMAAYYAEVYCLRQVHALPKHPQILEIYRQLFGRQPVPHARTVLRTLPADTNHVWPPHQDFVNVAVRGEVWNTWVPIGDCPREQGSLSILARSHKYGLARTRRIAENGLMHEETPKGLVWLSDDLNSGDVLMFSAMTFHQGQPNCMTGTLRMSVDNCIQPIDTPFVRGAFDVHRGDHGTYNRDLDWDDIYRNWEPADPLRYFWQTLPINVVDSPGLSIGQGGNS